MKLTKIIPSTRKYKKYTAIFKIGDDIKKVHFGDNRYSDYTKHHNKKRRDNYRSRHVSGKTANPDTPDALSYYILWGDSIDMKKNIRIFKNKYNL